MGVLDNNILFVAGGAGNIGANIVRGGLRAGATVVTASRDKTRFDRLRRFIAADGLHSEERLITLEGDVSDEAGALALRDTIYEQVGVPDAVIASLGGGMPSHPVIETPLALWNSVLHSNLTSHFLTARAFLPAMLERGRGVYLLISGYGGESTWPGATAVSVAAGGVIGLGRNLAAEHHKSGVRIQPMVLTTSERLWPQFEGKPGNYRGEDVGDFMAWLASAEANAETAEVIHFITNWEKANAIRHF